MLRKHHKLHHIRDDDGLQPPGGGVQQDDPAAVGILDVLDLFLQGIFLLIYIADLQLLSLLLAVVTVALTLYVPILTGQAVDRIVSQGLVDYEGLVRILAKILAAMALTAVSQWLMNHINNIITYRVVKDIRTQAFDPAKLEWCNAHFMREMPLAELAALTRPFVEEAGLSRHGRPLEDGECETLCGMFRERSANLKDLAHSFAPLLTEAAELTYDEKAAAKNLTEASRAHLAALSGVFGACASFTAPELEAALNAYVSDNGLKFKDVAPALRTALMGFMGGPHLPEIMAFLGREETLARLERAARA